ncbi:membrane protein [Candidatus Photodesmus blepharus]|uniref:Membrane protein n=1 Tax=Candidatus Photodesmus blepharonis TaxID=1179155 RepID=A0A084CMJ6_9GAMM|nr:DUF368 domain-containing protein [Candidatus Photodesmus blepharus]KEY91025.1 membrane protein [Candidatus Photodesmus blepharus]
MNYFGVFLKGILMGAADVVPGVSGGTIAFIAGIYDILLKSIRSINLGFISVWKKDGFKNAFEYINGFFLIALLGGILIGILTLAKLVSWLLVSNPIQTWSFFFGLILISAFHMFRQMKKQCSFFRFLFLVFGGVFAYVITMLRPLQFEFTGIAILFAGSLAICAMILPGISGSLVLIFLGMYTPMLEAVKSFQIDTLVLFLLGCVGGLLSFARLIYFFINKFRDVTLLFLSGLMLGSLPKLWPWKITVSWRIDANGELTPFLEKNLSPFEFEIVSAQPAQLGSAVIFMFCAVGLVLGLEKISKG